MRKLFLVALPLLAVSALCAHAIKVAPMSASAKVLKKCQVHGATLQTENVPIAYGLMRFQPNFLEAKKRLFPNANAEVLGGCILNKDSPQSQKVKFCPQCRIAQKRWNAAHKKLRYSWLK